MDVKSFFLLNCFCLLILYFNSFVEGEFPYGLCANPECSTPISMGITILQYSSPDDSRISVQPNEEVQIHVKDYGPKKDLWGVIVRGTKGYISKQFIREQTVYHRSLVPAYFEFKTSILITEPYVASSQLHASPYLHTDSSMNTVHQYAHTVQNDVLNSAPTIQQQWNSQSENSQASHLSNNLNPSHINHHDPHSQVHQSSQIYNVPEKSSHFHSENILPSHLLSMQHENILPSPTHSPNAENSYSNQHVHSDPLMASSFFESSVNVPSLDNFLNSNFEPNSALPIQHPSNIQQQQQQFQSLHANEQFPSSVHEQFPPSNMHQQLPPSNMHRQLPPSNMHQQLPPSNMHDRQIPPSNVNPSNIHQHFSSPNVNEKFQSPSIHDMQSSYSNDYDETYAMLKKRGFDNTGMYVNRESNIPQPSQILGKDFSEAEYNTVSSQLQHSSAQTDDAFSSSYIPLKEEKNVANSDVSHESKDTNNKGHDNTLVEKEETDEEVTDKENVEDENDESHDDEEEVAEEDGDEEEEIEATVADDLISSSKDTSSAGSGYNVQSSMSSPHLNHQSSNEEQGMQNSLKNPTEDSDTLDALTEELFTYPQEKIKISSKEVFSDTSSVLEATKVPKNIYSVQSNIAESITTQKIESNIIEAAAKKDISDIPDRNNNDAYTTENTYNKEQVPNINDFLGESKKNPEFDAIVSSVDMNDIDEDLATYQVRNLKGEFGGVEESQTDSENNNEENNTQSDSDPYSSYGNWFDALKAVIDSIISWIPEPLYSALMGLQNKGISPRVPVFTVLSGFTCIFLIVPLFYIKDRSKESKLLALLADVEKKAYTLSATNAVLEEKLESVQAELATLKASSSDERSLSENLKVEFENQTDELDHLKTELESCLEVIDALKEKENEFLTLINDHEREKECYLEHKDSLTKILKDQDNSNASLTNQLQESEDKVQELENEKEQFLQTKTDYEEKLSLFDRNCNQLLQEAEVWNLRVKELTETLDTEKAIKEEIMNTVKTKDEEIESLKELVETFKVFDEIEDPEEQTETKEEKLKALLNSAMIENQLKKEEEKSKLLDEQLGKEKNKILDMEVELLEAKSEIDKLKMSYNQALQDKAEAQTKLEVLTNYFKDKEIQLQRQLGAQEAVRQKKEEDANSAERRICLIEQENASYKSQVASMKQEMEETERTLRSQIAAQEKKAHENWIAARAAERNLENTKQEITQLRQRLTLLEREQENWANTSRDEIIRPVPKRVSDESGTQDLNTSERGMFPHPPLHDRLPLPPMMLPPDRPLPPLPPPIPPMFLPPPPHMERHFRSQPSWHMPPPDHSSDYRTTPPEFMAGRESTPPRGRQSTITDGDTAPHTSSPLTTDTRDSRNSTPPHLLPDFHDVPPQSGRPFFPPPVGRPRFPMQPPYRRDAGPSEPKRLDNPNEFNSRGSQQPQPPEQWQHSRV